MEAEASPLPSEETTPPVTKMNLVCFAVGLAGAVMVGLLSAWQSRSKAERSA
jgi:hypothetical protein